MSALALHKFLTSKGIDSTIVMVDTYPMLAGTAKDFTKTMMDLRFPHCCVRLDYDGTVIDSDGIYWDSEKYTKQFDSVGIYEVNPSVLRKHVKDRLHWNETFREANLNVGNDTPEKYTYLYRTFNKTYQRELEKELAKV